MSVNLCSSRVRKEPFFVENHKRLSLPTNGRVLLFDTICYVGICRIKSYLICEGNLVACQSKNSLLTSRITRGRFKFERISASACGYPVFEMAEYAGELPRKFLSFHCLEKESNESTDSNTERTENYPDLSEGSESKIFIIEETETSPAKVWQCYKSRELKNQLLEKVRTQTKNG